MVSRVHFSSFSCRVRSGYQSQAPCINLTSLSAALQFSFRMFLVFCCGFRYWYRVSFRHFASQNWCCLVCSRVPFVSSWLRSSEVQLRCKISCLLQCNHVTLGAISQLCGTAFLFSLAADTLFFSRSPCAPCVRRACVLPLFGPWGSGFCLVFGFALPCGFAFLAFG